MITESERLIIRRFREEDWADLYEYLSDPVVLEFEPYEPLSLHHVQQEAKRRAGDDQFYAVVLKDGGKLIGNLYFAEGEFDTWTLGYVFNRSRHGQGYARESVRALLDYAFEEMGVRRVVAFCSTENVRSWNLLEKLGLRREGLFLQNVAFKKDGRGNLVWFDSYQYALLRHEWRK